MKDSLNQFALLRRWVSPVHDPFSVDTKYFNKRIYEYIRPYRKKYLI